ncbi:MAG TPA: MBL fold metallo-hydrolase [Longimicrobiales bacterium]
MQVAPGLELIDLDYLGQPEAIAAALLETPDGFGVVDPGPTTSLGTLRAALEVRGASVGELRWVLLTHIHLDHGGGTGVLVRENPRLRVYVHERGAPHLEDPGKLIDSATRIYGDKMAYLWGEFLPVPGKNLQVLRGGERLDLAGRALRVAATPGHAWHHVSYLDERSGVAFVGDVCGERYPGTTFVIPVTPPPDIDIEAWTESWEHLRQWNPAAIFLTHFGPFRDVVAHLEQLERRTHAWAERVREGLGQDGTPAEKAHAFYDWALREMRDQLPAPTAERYARAAGVLDSWTGLARYWRKKAEKGAA